MITSLASDKLSRQKAYTDRGFIITVDFDNRKIMVSFNRAHVDLRHKDWLESVSSKVGLGELNPQPYWGFDDLFHKAGVKLTNAFFVLADVKIQDRQEYFYYSKIMILQKFSIDRFVAAIKNGYVLIDFDARTGHNHGTKFRLKQDKLPELYEDIRVIE